MPKCRSGLHSWNDPKDADRCCNGWTYLRVPLGYGQDFFGRISYKVEKTAPMWEPWLIKDTDQAEIRRILESSPEFLLKAT